MTRGDNTVNISVGAGSAASLRFIKEQILTRFGNPILDQLEDGGLVSIPAQKLVITTDSYVVNPPIFPGGNIGHLAISGTVNDLVACGSIPICFAMGLVIAEGFLYTDLQTILDSAAQVVKEVGISVVAGDTKVIERQAFSSIIISTTGLGKPIRPDKTYALSNAQIGDRILVTGTLGDHGLAILSLREGLGFEQRVKSDCAPLNDLVLPLLERFDTIHSLRDLSRGGLLNALSDLAEDSQTRVMIDTAAIPILNEVQMGCEMLGIDPFSMVNEGKMLIVVGSNESDRVLDSLRQHSLGSNSAIIGEIIPCDSSIGEVILRKGNQLKIQTRLEGDAIPRLC